MTLWRAGGLGGRPTTAAEVDASWRMVVTARWDGRLGSFAKVSGNTAECIGSHVVYVDVDVEREQAAAAYAEEVLANKEAKVVSTWGPYTSTVGTAKKTGVPGLVM